MACVVDTEPPTQFASDTFASIDVSVITTIVGQKDDKTTRSEPFIEKVRVFQ